MLCVSLDRANAGNDPELRRQAQEDNGEAIDRTVQATKLQEGDRHVPDSAVGRQQVVDSLDSPPRVVGAEYSSFGQSATREGPPCREDCGDRGRALTLNDRGRFLLEPNIPQGGGAPLTSSTRLLGGLVDFFLRCWSTQICVYVCTSTLSAVRSRRA